MNVNADKFVMFICHLARASPIGLFKLMVSIMPKKSCVLVLETIPKRSGAAILLLSNNALGVFKQHLVDRFESHR